jgi:hypothetical protein
VVVLGLDVLLGHHQRLAEGLDHRSGGLEQGDLVLPGLTDLAVGSREAGGIKASKQRMLGEGHLRLLWV